MREKLADAGGEVGVKPGKDVRQPLLEVDAVLPAGGREAGEDGHRDDADPAPREEPVPPPQAERADDVPAGAVKVKIFDACQFISKVSLRCLKRWLFGSSAISVSQSFRSTVFSMFRRRPHSNLRKTSLPSFSQAAVLPTAS